MRPVDNPPNPYHCEGVEWLEPPPVARLQVFEEQAKTILSENRSPDLNFRWSLNPYRGCFHGCAYCYARATHQYWDWGAGTDFERKLVVKPNAAALLRRAFERPSWCGESITFSGNTDCYQPLEAAHRLTRACLEVCVEYRNPVSVITKGALVRRDIDVLGELSRRSQLVVAMSIAFDDDAMGRAMEPYATSISKRFEAMEALSSAGIETAVALAPLIPGLNDQDVPKILQRARDAGARHAFMMPLRLSSEVLPVFTSRLKEALPDRADKIFNAIRDVRNGSLTNGRFHARMTGVGPRWKIIQDLFELHCRRLGLNRQRPQTQPNTFRRPHAQLTLF